MANKERLPYIEFLKGLDELYVLFKDIEELSSEQFYDGRRRQAIVQKHFKACGRAFYEAPKDKRQFFIKISDLYHEGVDYMDEDFIEEFIEPTLELLDFTKDEDFILKKIAIGFHNLFQKHILSDKKLMSVQLIDMDLESFFCLYFERSNSQGINLTFEDIITAKIYTKFPLKDEIKKAQEKEFLDDKKWVKQIIRYLAFKDHNDLSRSVILEKLKLNLLIIIGKVQQTH